ncbi:MAG: lipid-binding SYLF domain-containing protein [Sandaracinaceae bacterium]
MPTAPRVEERSELPDELPGMTDDDDVAEALSLAQEASDTLRRMKQDAELSALVERAQGLFIAPHYGRGAAGVGVRAGEGVLVARRGTEWSAPGFFDLGGVSLGAQLGAEGGEVVMILMTQEALDHFVTEDQFTLNADAGLTLADYSAMDEAAAQRDSRDVIFWSDAEGLFAGVALSITDVSWDEEENQAYYGRDVSPDDVVSGRARREGASAFGGELSSL